MAVNPFMVEEWLKRPLSNSEKAKGFTDEALDAKIAALDPQPTFVFPPMRHQKVAFLLCLKYGSYFPILDMGLGKSKLTLDVFAYRRQLGTVKRLLVLVPNSSNCGGWGEEVRRHVPWATFAGLDETVSRQDRIHYLSDPSTDIIAMTYMGWLSLVCTTRKERSEGQKHSWKIVEKTALQYGRNFDMVCFDESTAIANARGLPFMAARRLRKTCPYLMCLTGTPFNKDPIAMWAQFYAVDGGLTFGAHQGLFRAAFYTEKDNWFSGGKDFVFDKSKEHLVHAMMRNRSVRYSESECGDLPPRVGGMLNPSVRSVSLPSDTWAYYQRMVDELKAARGNYELMKNSYLRMRYLLGGLLPVTNDDGEQHDIVFKKNPKLDALIDLLNEIPADKKVIIFCVHRVIGDLISERLTKAKVKHVRLYGKTKDKNAVVEAFKTDPKVRGLLASASGAKGHNFQFACHHVIYYETFDDPETRAQSEKRIRRFGQTRTTYYYDLVVRGSIDERIMKSLRDGKRLFDLLVDGKEVA